MKRIAAFLTIMVLLAASLFGGNASSTYSATKPPAINGVTGCLIDAKTGVVIYDNGMNEPMAPASTTKMITALLVLENLPLDKQIVIDSQVEGTSGNSLGLVDGEIITVKDLLYGMMLYSANDAAVALAKAVSGSVSKFADLMNERATELGAKNTNFVNPNGLTASGHITTAYDLAMIAKGCMENQTFREVCKTVSYRIPPNIKSAERVVKNTNLMVTGDETLVTVGGVSVPAKYEYCIGIKTGSTTEAGNCLVAAAEKEGTMLISVIMKSGELERYSDSISLFEWGFENYRSHQVLVKGKEVERIRVREGASRKVGVAAVDDCYITMPNDAGDSVISTKAVLEDFIMAPAKAGTVVGKIEVYEGDRLVQSVDAVVMDDVAVGTVLSKIGISDRIAKPLITIVVILAALVAALALTVIILRVIIGKKKKKLRREKALELAAKRLAAERDKENRNWPY